ncbi:triose-phosphate isomerase [Brevibacterium jeotgali]|uniref:Triosephosphate isomerase n=1 Tax=Brevibacterium jeotgali TaxID=1262550 RepID=A0A2H1L1Z3_9MICO|nr:triose-phosphate isomerase [Brevibacterium jeotgali]TWC02905.1 triosephosphate isomerase [Brevibacterium jeotgali]SMY10927.1 triosephosphate isomerase [Brevibacterium jeotgali]
MAQTQRTPLIAGNWKMNLDHFEALTLVQKLAWALRDSKVDLQEIDVALLPPFTDIRSVQTLVQGEKMDLAYGAQDLSPHDAGAYTGDVSGAFLKRLGCMYALVGHSERREHHAEDDALVSAKIKAALRHDLAPVLCVGEALDVRQAGDHVAYVLDQVDAALDGSSADALAGLVIAYEPVWAIGTGETAGPADAQEMAAAIRARVVDTHGEACGDATRILYGGSVKTDNAAAIVSGEDVDGALVGGASLDPTGFADLIDAVHRVD